MYLMLPYTHHFSYLTIPLKYLVGRPSCRAQSSLDDDDTVKRPRTNHPRGLETQGERSNARTGQTLEMPVSKEKGKVKHECFIVRIMQLRGLHEKHSVSSCQRKST